MKTLVVIPTYNERDNIIPIYAEIKAYNPDVHVLFVDDNSPDKTFEVAQELARNNTDIFLLKREKKMGLGTAYIAGFSWGLQKGYEIFCEMDADFSHRPQDLKNILEKFNEGYDFIVGSRYVDGGGVKNWSWYRKLISRGGGVYSRLILGYPIRDWTGGFNAYKRDILLAIGLESVNSEGYSFQIELKYKSIKKGFKYCEVPIFFEERRAGKSKMSFKIFFEALIRVWNIRTM